MLVTYGVKCFSVEHTFQAFRNTIFPSTIICVGEDQLCDVKLRVSVILWKAPVLAKPVSIYKM